MVESFNSDKKIQSIYYAINFTKLHFLKYFTLLYYLYLLNSQRKILPEIFILFFLICTQAKFEPSTLDVLGASKQWDVVTLQITHPEKKVQTVSKGFF